MAEVAAPERTTLLSGSGHMVTPTVARTASSRRRSRQHQQLCADDPLRRCLKCPNSRRRERRPLLGMLLHIDGSKHRWFQDERWYDLLVILDDATSEIYYAQLVEEESTR